mgnify:CR=1 FL=1
MAKDIDFVWPLLQQHQGETFYTAKGLPFTYTIRGGELFVDRRSKSITISTVANALEKIVRWKWTVSPSLGRRKSAAMGQAISIRYCWRWGFLPFPTAVKM